MQHLPFTYVPPPQEAKHVSWHSSEDTGMNIFFISPSLFYTCGKVLSNLFCTLLILLNCQYISGSFLYYVFSSFLQTVLLNGCAKYWTFIQCLKGKTLPFFLPTVQGIAMGIHHFTHGQIPLDHMPPDICMTE